MNHDAFATIDLANLSDVTGGWNPFKDAWDKAKQIGQKVVDTGKQAVDYVKQHPEILIQGTRIRPL